METVYIIHSKDAEGYLVDEVEADTFSAARTAGETLLKDNAEAIECKIWLGDKLQGRVKPSKFGDGYTTTYMGTRTNANINGRYR